MKRGVQGQIAGQVLLYILGVITVGLLLLLGFRAVQTIEKNKCEVQNIQFQTDLSASIEQNKDAGSSKVERFTLPCDTTAVCFVSRASTDLDTLVADPGWVAEPRLTTIVNSVESGSDVNVFRQSEDGGYEPLERFSVAAPIDLPDADPIRCVPGTGSQACNGDIRIRFKGKGRLVEVEDAGCS